MSGDAVPRTAARAALIRDFEAYVEAVPTNEDFAIGGLLDILRRDRQSSLDQIRGAVLAIEAEAASPAALDAKHAPTIHHPDFGASPYIACKCGWGHYDTETDFMAHARLIPEEPS